MGKRAGQDPAEPGDSEDTSTGAAEGAPAPGRIAPGDPAAYPNDPKAPRVGSVKPDPYWAPHDADKV